jgi:hypothetical protein
MDRESTIVRGVGDKVQGENPEKVRKRDVTGPCRHRLVFSARFGVFIICSLHPIGTIAMICLSSPIKLQPVHI